MASLLAYLRSRGGVWEEVLARDSLLELLEPARAQCVLISYSREALHYAARNSDIATGWVLRRYDQMHREQALELQPEFLICNHDKIGQQQELWPGSWQWMLYDIVEPQLALDWARRGADPEVWIGIDELDDGELWETHQTLKARLLDFVRQRVSEQEQRRGAPPETPETVLLSGVTPGPASRP